MRRLWNWLTGARYASGGEIPGPGNDDRYQFAGYLSRGMCSFDGGETWHYTDEIQVLDRLNRRGGQER